jgi:1-hydroxycarotenoid 3,4-desaturase
MHALARALADLATTRGVRVHFGRRCERIVIERGRVAAIELADGERLATDAVVFNGDASALAQGLLGADAVRAQPRAVHPAQRSLSALTWAIHARVTGFPLAHHNVFFDDDYASEFDDVFQQRRLPRQGTVYVCAQDRLDGDGRDTPPGRERLLALVNAPADGDRRPFDTMETDPCEHRSLALLTQCGVRLSIDRPQQVQRCTPADFNRLYPGSGGALYGAATHGWTALFRRPRAQTALPGLYLAGGTVHPGPGVPMAAMSGRLAAEALMAHLDSTHRSRRAVTAGGTSMPSATTAVTP